METPVDNDAFEGVIKNITGSPALKIFNGKMGKRILPLCWWIQLPHSFGYSYGLNQKCLGYKRPKQSEKVYSDQLTRN